MPTSRVDLYLARHRVRVQVQTGHFPRLSDLLNSSAGAYLSGTSQLISELGELTHEAWVPSVREVVVSLAEVRFVQPLVEAPALPSPDLYRKRVQVLVELELDAWHLRGVLHLVDRVRWTDYLHSVRGRFLPMTEASAQLAGGSASLESDLLLINGARISALYAEPA